MLVLGIDPGTIRMGYGLVRSGPDPTAEDFGVVALPRSMPLERRLHQLYTHVLNMISIFQPDAISVEEPFVGVGDRRFAGPAMALVATGIFAIAAMAKKKWVVERKE